MSFRYPCGHLELEAKECEICGLRGRNERILGRLSGGF